MKKKEAGTLILKQDPCTASLISQSFFFTVAFSSSCSPVSACLFVC